MNKIIIVLGLSMIVNSLLYAQKEIPVFQSYHKNIYAEFLGSHLLAGVNYDMRLRKGRMDGIGFRAGIGGLSDSYVSQNTQVSFGIVTFPVEFNHIVGKRRSSFLSGVGLLPMYAAYNAIGQVTNYEFVQREGFGLAGGFLTLGYRFQPIKTGVMFQVNWNPMILRSSGFLTGWVGFGLGIGFK